jgi:hypothetical protein
MPAIRLADIPNAGPQALGPSTGILAPQAAQLGRAAMVDPGGMRNAAQSMLTQTLELDAFSQEARAMGKFADSIGGLGDVAMKWGQKFAAAKDDADLTRGETVLAEFKQKQLNEQQSLPPEKWQENWGRNQEEARRKLADIKFSGTAAEKFNPYLERWSTLTGVEIDSQFRKRQLDGYQLDAEIGYKRELAADNIEGALGIISRFEKNGTLAPKTAERFRFDVELETIKKSKAERNANIESGIVLDPQKWEEDLTQGIESGSSKLQTDLTKEEMLRFLPTARQQSRFAEVEKLSLVEDAMAKGEFQTVEELVKSLDRPDLMPNVKLPERAVQSLKASFFQTPEQIEHGRKLGPAVKHKIEAYDPADDPSFAGRLELIRDIHSLPEGYREDLRDELREKIRAFKETRKPIPSTPISTIKKMAKEDLDQGRYGKWNLNKDKIVPDDQLPARAAAHFRYDLEMTELDQWEKGNPEKARDPVEARKAYNDIITRLNKQDASMGRPSTRRPVDIPSISKPPANPSGIPDVDEVLRSAPTGASAPGAQPLGKVTSYNFPNDPYSDSNSRNRIGAWNNRLDDTSLAISPDIERKFKAAGIGKGDAVELTLADGSTMIRRWHDRTMQDEDAIKKFGKPLTGRFDIHSPGGKQKNDGMAVVSFRKAPTA